VSGLFDRTSLRLRLTVLSGVILLACMLIMGAVSSAVMTSYFQGKFDQRLQSTAARIDRGGALPALPPDLGPQESLPASRFYIGVFSASGQLIGLVAQPGGATISPTFSAQDLKASAADGSVIQATSCAGANGGCRAVAVAATGGDYIVVAGQLGDIDITLNHMLAVELLIGLIVVALGIAGTYVLVGFSLRRLRSVERASRGIAEGDFSQRVQGPYGSRELMHLGGAFNEMAATVEESINHERAAVRQATDAQARLKTFVADAGHELRTPLTAIIASAEWHRTGGGADVERTIQRIDAQAQQMAGLVSNLLLLANLDEGHQVDLAPIDLLSVLSQQVDAARVQVPDRQVDFSVDLESGLALVLAQEVRLRQVVDNLLSNAITHSQAPIVVRLITESDQVCMQVANGAPGMAPEVAAHVFDRFFQADPARTGRAGSSGLGLAIVQGIVDSFHGTISVDSNVQTGTTFTVRLPRAR